MHPSLLASDATPCRRDSNRSPILQFSTLRVADAPYNVRVEDLSPAGFAFTSTTPVAIGTIVYVGLVGAGRANAQVVWRGDQRHGCVFAPTLTTAQIEKAFTHAADDAVVSLKASISVARPRTLKLKRPTSLALLSLTSLIGWYLIVLILRNLPRF
ncbi:MAG: PilZ domain-containing protein [Oxalobacteraceae bacterium]|nr:MAG: PilZ domain-containing protein [Oxalobacteraceae bacterium]